MSTLSNMWKIIRPNYLQLNAVNSRINWEFNRERHRMSKLTSDLGLPARPKRPLNPYFIFSSEQRDALKIQYPGITVRELTKKLGELWKTYDPVKKERMKQMYKSQIETYTRDIMSYYESLTLEQQEMVKDYRENLRRKKIHKQLKQTYKDLGKPKRPVGPFVMYAHKLAEQKDVKMLYKDWMMSQGEIWKKLSDEDKEPYHIEYLKAKEKFKSDVIEWETKMIDMGNTHLVRKSVLRDLQGPNIEKLSTIKTSKNNKFNESEILKNIIEKVVENPLIENKKKIKKIKQSKAAVELDKVNELVDDIKSINVEDQLTIVNDKLVNDEKLINKTDKVVKDSSTENPGLFKSVKKSKKVANKLIDEEKSINTKDQPTIINDKLVNDEKLINKTDKEVKDSLTKNPDLLKPIKTAKKIVNKTDKVVKDPSTENAGEFKPIDTSKKVADKLIDKEKSNNVKDQPTIINDKLVNDEKLINKTDKVVEEPLTINPDQFKQIDTSKKVVELNKVDDKILNKVDESIEDTKVPKKLDNKTSSNVENPINKTDESIKEPANNSKTISSLWNWWK
ncbi:putative leucine-rich repeat-containing protein DDB_G0290503 [Aphidius gifuensis]|uniref:putative leucine-rich repeat-containing protein DDB_G0290503 n=1 Tax=Aphidius gifuensis TaxID=684658 RepID=UPI001CDC3BD9|nr:putative leucine-rich repeat-containing protein DDB_G0290503 [Aphidius gifuensis]